MPLEPSQPPWYASCPHCGCLISFEQTDPERIDALERTSAGPSDRSAREDTKRIIRDWVRHIRALSRAQVSPAEYFRQLVDGLVATLAARGGALWLGTRRRWKLEYYVRLDSVGISEKELRQRPHVRLVKRVSATGARCAVPPGVSTLAGKEANPTDSLLLLCPLTHASRIRGVVEIFQRTGARPATQRGYLRYLQAICSTAGESPVFDALGNRPWWRRWW